MKAGPTVDRIQEVRHATFVLCSHDQRKLIINIVSQEIS